MRDVVRAVVSVIAGCLGLVGGFIASFSLALSQDTDWRCDGVCFSPWTSVVGLVGAAVGGVVCALLANWLLAYWLRSPQPKVDPSTAE
jgi:hypothetical protein